MIRFVTINEDERGLLIKDGRFERVLEPGRHRFINLDFGRLKVEKFPVKDEEMTSNWARVIEKNHPGLAARLFEIVSVGENEVALVSFDGRPVHLLPPWSTRYYWKVLSDVSTEFIDTSKNIRVDKKYLNSVTPGRNTLAISHIIDQHQTGLLFVDGQFVEQLKPGRHVFWTVHQKVQVKTVDLHPQPIEITAQEILTRDRVSLRVTLTAYARVTDPIKVEQSSADHTTYIYRLVQFAVREAIANRTLDEILNNRETIDDQLRAYMKDHMDDIGVEVTELGIKDIILPGDMRELINKVVEAEKTAQANLIRRREETAATRALLNTAKLMENNPLLLRLKEIESLEKLTEKVGRIDLHTGDKGGLDALMSKLLTLDTTKSNDE